MVKSMDELRAYLAESPRRPWEMVDTKLLAEMVEEIDALKVEIEREKDNTHYAVLDAIERMD